MTFEIRSDLMKRLALAVALSLFCGGPLEAAMTKAQAKKLIAEYGLPETGEGMLAFLNVSSEDSPKLIEAFLTIGIRADQPVTYVADGNVTLTRYPLNYLLMFSCSDKTVAEKAKLLLDAGADPNMTDPENDWAALAQVHSCPHVTRVLLAAPKKPDVNRTDGTGRTAMHFVVLFSDGDAQLESIRMLLDAGYDIERFRQSLYESARQKPAVMAALGFKTAPAPAKARPVTTPAPVARIDWKALPPYPTRTSDEAKKLLHRPGAATTIDEHMWDGITHREGLRLAAALQAGANVRQTRSGTNYTPRVLLAERCDLQNPEIQTSNAELLIAAGADLTGVDSNGANALILAADNCPVGVVRALLAAGVSPNARTSNGTTALRNAISDNRADVVELLLDAGVDPKKEPYNVRAWASGKSEIEALLRKKRK
jgi:ankyrin repeat protein